MARKQSGEHTMTMREIGARGGKRTKERYGREHYRALGKKGGAEVKRLVALGRERERARGGTGLPGESVGGD